MTVPSVLSAEYEKYPGITELTPVINELASPPLVTYVNVCRSGGVKVYKYGPPPCSLETPCYQ